MKNLPFAARVYEEIETAIKDEFYRRMFVAQAMLETGWGADYPEETNNVMGIKPVGDQQFIVYKGARIRKFRSLAHCAWSWFYLIRKSSHYDEPRNKYLKAIARLEQQFDKVVTQEKMKFAQEFLAGYCPSAAHYFKVWNRIRFDLTEELWKEEDK